MRRLNVAQAKAQFSALLDAVEQGEDVEITRRGVPVARLTRPPMPTSSSFELSSFLEATLRQPLHTDVQTCVQKLREGVRY